MYLPNVSLILVLIKHKQSVNDTERMTGLDCIDLKRLLRAAFFWDEVEWSEELHFCVTATLITSFFIII